MISFSTLGGAILGCLVMALAIMHETKEWQVFLSPASLAIVLGGTLTVTCIGFRFKYIWNAFLLCCRIFLRQPITPKSLMSDVKSSVEWARKVQAEGPGAYESIAKQSKDEFTRYVYGLAGTGYKAEDIRNFGSTSIEEHYFRHLQEANILNNMASMTPAFGLVGTLLGLIVMLGKLEDPSKLGPGLSLALTATLYGLLFARFVFMPASTKGKQLMSIERFRHYLVLEGLILIMEKRPSMYIQDRLNSFLDRGEQYSMFKDQGAPKSQAQGR